MAATEVKLTIETGDPAVSINARRAAILIGGVEVLSEVVYDTEPAGDGTQRSAAAAERNVLFLFGGRLQKLLLDEED